MEVSSQSAAPLNGSNADGYTPRSSTGRIGSGSGSGRRQPPSDEAVCRVRAGLTCLEPTGTVLPNRLNAEGRELISGAGSGVSGWAADFEAGRSEGWVQQAHADEPDRQQVRRFEESLGEFPIRGRGGEAHSATVGGGGASRCARRPHRRGLTSVASVPAQSQRHARECGARGDGVSGGDALVLAVGVAAVRHTARPRAVVAPAAVRGGHTAEE